MRYSDCDTSLHFICLHPTTRLFWFDLIWLQGNMITSLTNMVRIYIPYCNLKIATYNIALSTKNIDTMMSSMVWWMIDLWWSENPPTNPPTLALFWGRIERKGPLKRGRSSFEKSFQKDNSLSLSLSARTRAHQNIVSNAILVCRWSLLKFIWFLFCFEYMDKLKGGNMLCRKALLILCPTHNMLQFCRFRVFN